MPAQGHHRDAGKRTTLHHFVDVWCVRCMLPDSCKSDLAKVMEQRRKKTTRLTVSLDDADYAAVNAMASSSDVSLSWVIRQAIHEFVRNHGAQPELPLTLAKKAGGKEVSG